MVGLNTVFSNSRILWLRGSMTRGYLWLRVTVFGGKLWCWCYSWESSETLLAVEPLRAKFCRATSPFTIN